MPLDSLSNPGITCTFPISYQIHSLFLIQLLFTASIILSQFSSLRKCFFHHKTILLFLYVFTHPFSYGCPPFYNIIVIFLTIVNNITIIYPYFILLKGELTLIEYSPFWNTLKNSTESTYTLITQYHVSSATIDKLRKNKPMNTTTLNDLCRIFDCQIQDICQYTPSTKDQHL